VSDAPRSRISPDEPLPYSKLFEVAAQEAQKAEIMLLRKLLLRSYGALQNVATKSRQAGERDAIVETLMRDISTAMYNPLVQR
jgi:hypothetical protein